MESPGKASQLTDPPVISPAKSEEIAGLLQVMEEILRRVQAAVLQDHVRYFVTKSGKKLHTHDTCTRFSQGTEIWLMNVPKNTDDWLRACQSQVYCVACFTAQATPDLPPGDTSS